MTKNKKKITILSQLLFELHRDIYIRNGNDQKLADKEIEMTKKVWK